MTAAVSAIAARIAPMIASAAASGAGQAAGAAASSGGFDIVKTLSTGLSLASAGMSLFGANEKANANIESARIDSRAYLMDAQEAELEAKREEIRGRQAANEITDSFIQTLAQQRLGFASNGMDISFGTPDSVRKSTTELANRQLSVSREDALINAIARRRQASAYREASFATLKKADAEAGITRRQGVAQAVGTLADTVERRVRRG